MSNQRDSNMRNKRNDHSLINLPTDVLLKARSTLGTLLKSKHDQQRPKLSKQESKDYNKNKEERLKISRSEPQFSELHRKNRRSRVEEGNIGGRGRQRPRPQSVGPGHRHMMADDGSNLLHIGILPYEMFPLSHRSYDSAEEICVQSRLVIPVSNDRLNGNDMQTPEGSEKPRKKLSFREPEVIGSDSATLCRSNKLMGVNSLSRRPQRPSMPPERHSTSLEGLENDLESQAMRIVRTVGQAFEVCHKMQSDNSAEGAAAVASTSSAVDDNQGSDLASGVHAFKEVAPECESTESCAASTRTPEVVVPVLEEPSRPTHLELLPPPPRKDGRRSPQRATVELPECVTKVEVVPKEPEEATTPLSAQHQLQLLRERLEQQTQQTRAAVAQLLLLRDQLAAEQAARCEAQARTHQLLVHNKELLEHIAALVAHLQEREKGISRPISAQHLTLLPQTAINHGVRSVVSNGNLPSTNRNPAIQNENTEMLVNLISNGNKITQNIENNNVRLHPFDVSPVIPGTPVDGVAPSLSFGEMTNEQVQNYLTTKFQAMTGPKLEPNDRNTQTVSYNQHFFQNSNAFPNIPPLTNHFSNSDIASLLNHNVYGSPKNANGQSVAVDDEMGLAGIPTMNLAQSQNSLYSTSPAATSKDSTPDAFSSDDGALFIMPLSHKGTLTAKCEDGRVKLIVPVSPSGSVSDVGEARVAVAGGAEADGGGSLLRVPTTQIARTTSEKVPNRSEMMTALRSQWTRHTTK